MYVSNSRKYAHTYVIPAVECAECLPVLERGCGIGVPTAAFFALQPKIVCARVIIVSTVSHYKPSDVSFSSSFLHSFSLSSQVQT